MAVQAHYPSQSFLLNEPEAKEMDYTHNPHMFFSNGVNINGFQENQRKRARESNVAMFQMLPTQQMNIYPSSSSNQSPNYINQLQVSTGLHLSFQDKNQCNEELSCLMNQQAFEMEQYLNAQGEKLRRTLAEKHQAHYRALLVAAERSATNKLREKELEITRNAKKSAELETRYARIRNESLTWQAKAVSEQEKIGCLQLQIQQARLASVRNVSGQVVSEVEDCGSVYEDPNRVEILSDRACRVCGVSDVSVVVIPCRHLCMCTACDTAFGNMETVCCPVCNVVRTGSIQVFLS